MILISKLYSNEPVDIWNVDKKTQVKENTNLNEKKNEDAKSIYEINSQKINKIDIEEDDNLFSKKIEVIGLYDPEKNNFTIDMWNQSDGNEILKVFNRIYKIKLSNDAKNILNKVLLTNTYYPNNNISKQQFLKIKSDWLIKSKNFKLIEDYLIKNQNINENIELTNYLVNEYLTMSEIERSCNIFSKIENNIVDDYLSKFNIYCLINDNKRDEAQLQFDLKQELGFKDSFFEDKFNYLMGYIPKANQKISEKNILEFHLSHKTISNFKFEPKNSTSKQIWRYLSTSNLLISTDNIDLKDQNKITLIEKATHDRNYTEEELFNLYKRFQFDINQLLNVEQAYKLLTKVESRALLYQGILITTDIEKKIKLIELLKDLFIKDSITFAFKNELTKLLKDIDEEDIPSNYTAFYNEYINDDRIDPNKIKINNKIIHQSKIINYFDDKNKINNIEKDLNDLLKKIKKDKKYFVSIKDKMMLDSLKSDGINIKKKYKELYETDEINMPTDIQVLVDNNEIGLVLLRLIEIIGQDQLENIGPETLYFIIYALNKLNIDPIRNEILLKVLPLKA